MKYEFVALEEKESGTKYFTSLITSLLQADYQNVDFSIS
jgi:hypothetical protein